MYPVRFNSGIQQNRDEFFLELLPDRIPQLLPFLQRSRIKLKAIAHPEKPSPAEVSKAFANGR